MLESLALAASSATRHMAPLQVVFLCWTDQLNAHAVKNLLLTCIAFGIQVQLWPLARFLVPCWRTLGAMTFFLRPSQPMEVMLQDVEHPL